MKNIKKLLLCLIIMVFAVVPVNAKESEPFHLEFGDEEVPFSNPEQILAGDNFGFKDGYISIKADADVVGSRILYYDAKGEILAENFFEYYVMIGALPVGDYVYVAFSDVRNVGRVDATVAGDSTEDASYPPVIMKLDENMEVVASKEFEIDAHISSMIMEVKGYGYNTMSYYQDNIYIYCGGEYILKIDNNLSTWSSLRHTWAASSRYFPALSYGSDLMDEAFNEYDSGTTKVNMFLSAFINDNNIVTSGARVNVSSSRQTYGDVYSPFTSAKGILRLTDSDENVIFDKTYFQYEVIISPKIIGDYIVAIGVNDTESMHSEVVVFDKTGKIVQTIAQDERAHLILNVTDDSFIVTEFSSGTCPDVAVGSGSSPNMFSMPFDESNVEAISPFVRDRVLEDCGSYRSVVYAMDKPLDIVSNPNTGNAALVIVFGLILVTISVTLILTKKNKQNLDN